jgi:hypothetical protein
VAAPAPQKAEGAADSPHRDAEKAPRRAAHAESEASDESSDRPGSLDFRVVPWAEVYIDGVRRGITPMDPVPVLPGHHVVRLVNSEINVTRDVPVTVKSGRTTWVKEKLK